MTKKILQIVPRLPLFNDGVGDYAVNLAEKLRQNFQMSTDFLVFETQGKIRELNDCVVYQLPNHNPDAFMSVLPQNIDTIILQYSNYPYLKNKFAAPFWLIKALELAKNAYQFKIIVMFHELPLLKWNSFSVLNPIQALLSYQLAKLADVCITNNGKIQSTLSQWLNKPVISIPNFSTIGEPNYITPLSERKPQMVIFGTTHNRARIYSKYLQEVVSICQKLGIKEIYDIGQKIDINLGDLQGIGLIQMDKQPSKVVSEIMLSCQFGFLDYSWYQGCLGKSTVFAAFCAHGLVTILSKYNPSEADGIFLNQHYLVGESSLNQLTSQNLQLLADNAYQWYSSHNLLNNAKLFAAQILS